MLHAMELIQLFQQYLCGTAFFMGGTQRLQNH